MLHIGVLQQQHPGNSWLYLFTFILKDEDGLYLNEECDRVGSPVLQLLEVLPVHTPLIWLSGKLMSSGNCWLPIYRFKLH